MADLGQLRHHCDLPLMLWDLIQHFFFHELDSDDPVFGEMVALEDHPVVSLPQGLATIDVEVLVKLLHALHLNYFKISSIEILHSLKG